MFNLYYASDSSFHYLDAQTVFLIDADKKDTPIMKEDLQKSVTDKSLGETFEGIKSVMIELVYSGDYIRKVCVLEEIKKNFTLEVINTIYFPVNDTIISELRYSEELSTNGSYLSVTTTMSLVNEKSEQIQIVTLLAHEIRITTKEKLLESLKSVKKIHDSLLFHLS